MDRLCTHFSTVSPCIWFSLLYWLTTCLFFFFQSRHRHFHSHCHRHNRESVIPDGASRLPIVDCHATDASTFRKRNHSVLLRVFVSLLFWIRLPHQHACMHALIPWFLFFFILVLSALCGSTAQRKCTISLNENKKQRNANSGNGRRGEML